MVKQCWGGADIQSVLEHFDFTLWEFFVSKLLRYLVHRAQKSRHEQHEAELCKPKVGIEKKTVN